jgi:hypothetical protein
MSTGSSVQFQTPKRKYSNSNEQLGDLIEISSILAKQFRRQKFGDVKT